MKVKDYVQGIARAKRWARRIWLAMHRRAVILLYHRVAELPSDPQLLCVSPEHFKEHLEHLRDVYHPLGLRELTEALKRRQVPDKGVVVTFDDGYADNLHYAAPLLEAYGIPATIFVTSGCVGIKRAFWGRELERILLWSDRLPGKLKVTINGKVYEWILDDDSYACEVRTEEYWRWDVTVSCHPTPRHEAYRELCSLIRPLDKETRGAILTELREQAEFRDDKYPDAHPLDVEELIALSKERLIEIASHTVTHPVLVCQSLDTQRWELEESKRQLEALIGQPVTSFSYPYGGQADVGDDGKRLVREAGYDCACANFPAPVTSASHPYWLPRYLIRNWNGEEFARRVRNALRGRNGN